MKDTSHISIVINTHLLKQILDKELEARIKEYETAIEEVLTLYDENWEDMDDANYLLLKIMDIIRGVS